MITPPLTKYTGETLPQLPARRSNPHPHKRYNRPTLHADVFVDDEIVVAQGTPAHLNRIRQQLLHLNDTVFRPNDDTWSTPLSLRPEPISLKKL